MIAPSEGVVNQMKETYARTEKTGNEHGFRVGNKGTISRIVEGKEKSIDVEWSNAIADIRDAGDLVSYDVHSHPMPVYKECDTELQYNNLPSDTDIQNTVGNSPSIVLGYAMV